MKPAIFLKAEISKQKFLKNLVNRGLLSKTHTRLKLHIQCSEGVGCHRGGGGGGGPRACQSNSCIIFYL